MQYHSFVFVLSNSHVLSSKSWLPWLSLSAGVVSYSELLLPLLCIETAAESERILTLFEV